MRNPFRSLKVESAPAVVTEKQAEDIARIWNFPPDVVSYYGRPVKDFEIIETTTYGDEQRSFIPRYSVICSTAVDAHDPIFEWEKRERCEYCHSWKQAETNCKQCGAP